MFIVIRTPCMNNVLPDCAETLYNNWSYRSVIYHLHCNIYIENLICLSFKLFEGKGKITHRAAESIQ